MVESLDVLLELGGTPLDITETFLVRDRNAGDDAAYRADRLVDDGAVPGQEFLSGLRICSDEGFWILEAGIPDHRRLTRFRAAAEHRRRTIHDQARRILRP